jgi:hypothetical protein
VDHDLIFYQFSRCKVERGDFSHFLKLYAFDKPPTARRLRDMMDRMVFCIEGYDDDPREIHSIPEVRKFYSAFHDAWPYRLYFCNLDGETLNRGKRVDYAVYALEDTEPLKRNNVLPPQEIDLLAAVWAVNRRAKRCRDLACNSYSSGRGGAAANFAEEGRRCYRLKDQVLHYLRQEGRVQFVDYHVFRKPNEPDRWAEFLEGEGYTFHAPCEAQIGASPEKVLSEIEAKPRGSGEPKLKDALHTLEKFLKDKPKAQTYSWPKRIRPQRPGRNPRDEDDDDPRENEGVADV